MVTKNNEVEKAMIFTLFGRLSLVQPPLESHSVSSQGVIGQGFSIPLLIPMVIQPQNQELA